jgi:hypothetical protein
MYKTYSNICYWFRDNQWEIYVGVCAIVILFIWFYNMMKDIDGKWSKSFDFDNISTTCTVCPAASSGGRESNGESRCRTFLTNYFKKPFVKVRTIYNPVTQQYLELDCYNESERLAVEYQGAQHYKYTPYFHKNVESFRNQQYRDMLKRIHCKESGITLIEVPYTVDDIERYLRDKLQNHSYAPR